MEILSDATFRGATTFKKDVSIDGGNFSVTLPGSSNPSIRTNYSNGGSAVYNFAVIGSEFIRDGLTAGGKSNLNSVYVTNGIRVQGSINMTDTVLMTVCDKKITFPNTDGKLALISDIPSIRIKSLPIDFDVPADCTRFYVPGINMETGYLAKPYSLQMVKKDKSPTKTYSFYLKNIDLTLVSGPDIPNYSGTNYSSILVEKSSAFAISASDGYSIKMILGWDGD